ncbi:MAG: leucine-rich repeat protein [Lachnospiraceae bacterium]|nr:leucine-rich repeat protein [Lachnospiraceae bacterium]
MKQVTGKTIWKSMISMAMACMMLFGVVDVTAYAGDAGGAGEIYAEILPKGAAESITPMTITAPGQIEELVAADEGLVYVKTNDSGTTAETVYAITVNERGWLFFENYRTNEGTASWHRLANTDLYANSSLSKEITPNYWPDNGKTYYLDKGIYYLKIETMNCTHHAYMYWLPSSSVLSADVTLNETATAADINYHTSIGSTICSWVNDKATVDKIASNQFYSNSEAGDTIHVTDNGTYSIRVKSSLDEWLDYPVDILVDVEGIVETSGSCGEDVTWKFDSDSGTLTISGTGTISEKTYDAYRSDIKTIVIEDGVKGIGKETFYGCSSLTDITIPKSVTDMDDCGLGFLDDENGNPNAKSEQLTISGYTGTAAETYAKDNGFDFDKLDPHVHTYGEPAFTWTETNVGYTVTAAFTCVDKDDTQVVRCTVTSTTKEATYAADGLITYTASVKREGTTYQATKIIRIPKKEAEEDETEDAESTDNTQKPGSSQTENTKKLSAAKQTGWVKNGSTWYYTDENGTIQTGWVNVGGTWYYMSESGAMETGWVSDGGTWYYMSASGAMETGWVSDGSAWYYMSESGAMETGWVSDGSAWYYMSESGAMETGWVSDGGKWYYMSESGAMQTGWLKDGSAWYHLSESGAMQTGWYTVSGKWYYSYASGVMAANTRIGAYRLNRNGEWVR